MMGRVKVKTLNNKHLTGEMISNLVESYVQALNRGAAPNISSAWTYICKSECIKGLREGEDLY